MYEVHALNEIIYINSDIDSELCITLRVSNISLQFIIKLKFLLIF